MLPKYLNVYKSRISPAKPPLPFVHPLVHLVLVFILVLVIKRASSSSFKLLFSLKDE